MTAEMALLSTALHPHPPPRSRMYTGASVLANINRQTLPTSAKPTYLNVYDSSLLTPTLLTFMCTQVLWCLARVARPRASGVTMDPDIRLTILSTRVHS